MKLVEIKDIFEMATLDPSDHGFGINIKLNILQPGDKKLPHEPCVKCFKRGAEHDFSIELNEEPAKMRLIGDYSEVITTKEFNKLFEAVKKYRIPFLNMWFDSQMGFGELREQMAKVDAGEEVEFVGRK